MKRLVSVVVTVAVGIVVAWAAPTTNGPITVAPALQVGSGAGSSSFTATNESAAAISVTAISRAASCAGHDGSTITAQFLDHPTNMFTFTTGTSELITTVCPSGGPSATGFGIRRCEFLIDTSTTPAVAGFTQMCVYAQNVNLTAAPGMLDFATVMVGSTDMATTFVSTSAAVSSLYYSLADEFGAFEIMDCGDVHCLDTVPLDVAEQRGVTITCTPPYDGTFTAELWIVANTGASATPVMLTCNGSGGAGDINLSDTNPMLSTAVATSTSTTITLHNEGTGPLEITGITPSGSTDFTLVAMTPCDVMPCTLQAGEMAVLDLGFQPSTIGGITASFAISSDDPDENPATIMAQGVGEGSTLALASAVTSPVDIGSAPVGTPVSRVISVKNEPATESIGAMATVTNTGVFAVTPASHSLAAEETKDFTITCTPQAVGTTSASFEVTSMATFGSPIELTVECTGTAPSGTFSVNPAAIDLGEVRIDGMGPRVVRTVEVSTSGSSLQLGAITEQPDAAQVTLGAPTSTDVVMGAPATFEVSFDPLDQEIEVMTAIQVTAGGETKSIPLAAKVVRAMIAAPAMVDFGSVCIGATAEPQTLRLASTGSATIALASRPELGQASSPFTLEWLSPDGNGYPVSLATNEEVTVRVAPKPQTVAAMYGDELAWTTDLPMSPRTQLAVRYVGDGGAVAPGRLGFGGVEVRQSSAAQAITVQNCATGELVLGAATFSKPDDFVIIGDPLPATLAAGASATLMIAFVPQQVGALEGTLTIATSAGDHVVYLDGTGLGTNTIPVSPGSLYACDCSSSEPGSALVILLALGGVLVPRRRRRC